MNQENKTSYIKNKLFIKRSSIAFAFLFLAILPRVIWMTREILPENPFLQVNLENLIGNTFQLTSLKILSFTWMFIIITIFEFSKSRKFNHLSILRGRKVDKWPHSDFFYFIFTVVNNKFNKLTLITLFATLGLSGISSIFSKSIDEFYQDIFSNDLLSNNFKVFVVFIIGIFLMDFWLYIGHRISHSFLWELHEFHHSAQELTIFTLFRESFLEKALISFTQIPILVLAFLLVNQSLEQGSWILFILWTAFGILGEAISYIAHSSLKVLYPKPFSYVFMSPSLHWIHHSDNQSHFNKNFGRVFCIWDRIFGTYLGESHLKDINGFGISGSSYNKYNPFYCFYILPTKKILAKKLLFKK